MQPAGRSRPRITAVLIGGGLLIAAAGSAGYFLRSAPPVAGPLVTAEPSWEQSHRAELLQLKADAEAAILVGDLKTGYDKYAQLHTLAAAHRIQDPSLLSALQFADAARERVYTMLLAKPPAVPDASLETQATNNIIPATSPAGDAPANPPAITTITEPSPPDPLPAIRSLSPITPVPVSMPGHEADLQITAALENGIAFLLAHFKDGEITDSNPPGSMMHQGLNALCVYAVLHAGEGGALRDPRLNIHSDFMQKLIAKMKAHPMQPDANTPRQPVVYARSLRAAALAVYNRQEDQQALRADVAWLVKAARDGAYSYDDRYGGLSDNTKPDDLADLTEKGGSDSGSPDLNENGGSEPAPPDGSGSPGPFGGNPAHMYNVQRHWSVDRDMPGTLARSNPGTLAQQSWHIKAMDAWRQTTARRPPSRSGCRQFRRFPGGPGTHPKPGRISAPLAATGIPAPVYGPLQTDAQDGPPNPPNRRPIPLWDNSNSQYGLLGVWSGAEAGVEVPAAYWKAVEKHWLACEMRDGQWCYSAIDQTPTLSMDCAGVASLLITHEWLDAPAMGARVGRPPYSKGLAAGLEWLEGGDHITSLISPDLHYLGYTAYGIERCALASGFKYFGERDWFREVSALLLKYQLPNGAWGREADGDDALIDTAYIVLFLRAGNIR